MCIERPLEEEKIIKRSNIHWIYFLLLIRIYQGSKWNTVYYAILNAYFEEHRAQINLDKPLKIFMSYDI